MSQSLGAAVEVEFDVGINTTSAAVEGDAGGFGIVVHFDGSVGAKTSRHGLIMQDSGVAQLGAKITGDDPSAPLSADTLQAVLDFFDMSLPIVSGAVGKAVGEKMNFGAVSGINLADSGADLHMADEGFVEALVRMEYVLKVGDEIACPMLYLLPADQARTLAAKAPAAKPQPAPSRAAAPAASGPKATFPEFEARGGGGSDMPENIAIIMDIQLEVVARLGSVQMPIRDILKLGPGSIIDIDRPADGPVDLVVNDKLVARGDVVVVQENFGLKITEVQSAQERIASLR